MVQDLLKVHKIEDATNRIVLMNQITDSLNGKLFINSISAAQKSGKMEPILPSPSEEFKDANNFEDLELTEENSDAEQHNLVNFGKDVAATQELDINDL